jgi:hypothetical protein
MKPIAQITRVVAVLLVSSVLALTLWTPASAQLAPPNRDSVMLRVAAYPSPIYMAGFSWTLNRQFDLVGTYNLNSATGGGNLWDAGVRYHLRGTPSGVDAFVGLGYASVSVPFLTFATGSGITGGGGASVHLSNLVTGYGSVNLLSIGGTTSSILDYGVELEISNRVSGQLGIINFAGIGEPYVGFSFALH